MPPVIPSRNPRRTFALDTEQESTPRPSVSYGGSSASGTRPSITTSADLNTDMTREVRARPAPDVTRASGEDHVGGDVLVTRAERGRTTDEGSQRRGNHVKSEMIDRALPDNTFRGGSSGKRRLKLWLSPHRRHWTAVVRKQ